MTPLVRWAKFNAVGVMGMAVQLGALAVLNHWMRGHYLIASGLALEVTLLHNFVWHVQYTWRDRRERGSPVGQMMKFHLSNGMVSMVGNLVLMRLLVQEARLPVVAANAIAIVCCSVANYCLGDTWAFAAESPVERGRASRDSRLVRLLRSGPCR
jgi:putative flippase GtrA